MLELKAYASYLVWFAFWLSQILMSSLSILGLGFSIRVGSVLDMCDSFSEEAVTVASSPLSAKFQEFKRFILITRMFLTLSLSLDEVTLGSK